jgi:hypothetical protein
VSTIINISLVKKALLTRFEKYRQLVSIVEKIEFRIVYDINFLNVVSNFFSEVLLGAFCK